MTYQQNTRAAVKTVQGGPMTELASASGAALTEAVSA